MLSRTASFLAPLGATLSSLASTSRLSSDSLLAMLPFARRAAHQPDGCSLMLLSYKANQSCGFNSCALLSPRPQPGAVSRHLFLHMRHASTATGRRKQIVFLGTPQVSADALEDLVAESRQRDADFEVCSVVTKAPSTLQFNASTGGSAETERGYGRQNNLRLHQAALDLGFSRDQILTPASPSNADFLRHMRELSPDLCVTAAYGGMLPQAFLDIPACGTINIHPSLLPRYRGAAPVQRAVERGDEEVGVSLVYTVLKCDAGPVLDQVRVSIGPDVMVPELTSGLFKLGTTLLLARMSDVLSGRGRSLAREQDPTMATYAKKVERAESFLDTGLPASLLHNRVRALSGWPGTYVKLLLKDLRTGNVEPIQVSIVRSRVVQLDIPEDMPDTLLRLQPLMAGAGEVGHPEAAGQEPASDRVHYINGRMLLPCGGSTMLEVLLVKPRSPNERSDSPVSASDFMRSLGKQCRLLLPSPPSSQGGGPSSVQ